MPTLIEVATQANVSTKTLVRYLAEVKGVSINDQPQRSFPKEFLVDVLVGIKDFKDAKAKALKQAAIIPAVQQKGFFEADFIHQDGEEELEELGIPEDANTQTAVVVPKIPYGLIPSTYQPYRSHTFYEPFQFLIRKWYAKIEEQNKEYTHSQMGRAFFKDGKDLELITSIVQEYREYFQPLHQPDATKLLPNWPLIYKEFPQIWGIDCTRSFKGKMLKAVEDEIRAVGRTTRASFVKLKGVKMLQQMGSNVRLYVGTIIPEGDDLPAFAENTRYRFRSGKSFLAEVTVLFYAPSTQQLFFQTSRILETTDENCRIQQDSRALLKNLKSRISNSVVAPQFSTLFNQKPVVLELEQVGGQDLNFGDLDATQTDAFGQAIWNNITFIWGPPGTGKSHTLACILQQLKGEGGRTLVVSTANTAVDELTLKFVKANPFEAGEVLRIGRTVKPEIEAYKSLFPDDSEIQKYQADIMRLRAATLKAGLSSEERATLESQIEIGKHELATLVREYLSRASVIFCSASKALQDGYLQELEFDNLIVEEASMLSPAYLYPLLHNVKKRLIIAGDPKQLGPISVAKTKWAEDWLQRDLFALLGTEKSLSAHRAVAMLKKQRRFHADISQCINSRFYESQLQTHSHSGSQLLLQFDEGEHDQNKGFVSLAGRPNFQLSYTKGRSCHNIGSRQAVWEFLQNELGRFQVETIGVIAPYRAQINRYKDDLESMQIKPKTIPKFGTIHAFQGGECDVILLDLTDSLNDDQGRPRKPGSLFRRKTGERLINVAVSRAKKLVVAFGDKAVFKGAGAYQVSPATCSLIQELPAWRFLEI